jgi:uracil-DNA glycosylase family 4
MRKHPLADCEHCPLQGQPFVPSKIPPQGQTKYVVIGEAPGFQEKIWGEPFVGPSGQLMKDVLKRSGINEKECLFTNVVLCHPEDNVDPPKDAIAACKPRLIHEIETARPERVLTVGGIAAKAILGGQDGILKARVGPPRDAPYGGRTVLTVPTVHPAAVLRSSDYFPFLVTDVQKLTAAPKQWSPPRYKVADTERKAQAYIKFLGRFHTLAVDIETAVEKDVAYEHPEDTDILCIGIAYDNAHAIIFPGAVLGPVRVRQQLGQVLARVRLIAQNGKFDVPVLQSLDRRIRLEEDTMLAHYCLDERGGIHALEPMAREHLGSPPWKYMAKEYTRNGQSFANIPPPILYLYNAYDDTNTYGLHEFFEPQLAEQNVEHLYRFLIRASDALMHVEADGVSIDTDARDQLDKEFQAKLVELEAGLQPWVKNPRSWQQVQAALLKLGVTTESTDVAHLRSIRKGMEAYGDHAKPKEIIRFVDALLNYRKQHKLWSTYIVGIGERLHRGKLHTSYLLHGTTTGRLSSRNPNLQNIPRGDTIRGLFVPSQPDHVFVQADFKQGEWRLVSCLANEQYFIRRFNESPDPLAELQADLWDGDKTKELRVKTKNILYGSLYGMILGKGVQGVEYAELLDMSNAEAYQYQRRLFDLAPNIERWQNVTRQFVLNGGQLTTFMGRKRRFWLITDSNRKDVLNECLAFVPQSTLSDICLLALCELVEQGFKVRLTVHDSIVVECHKDKAEETSSELSRIFGNAAKNFSDRLPRDRRIPFPVESTVGRSWGECG